MKMIKSFSCAWQGLRSAWRSELNLRIHVGVSVLVVIAGFYFRVTPTEWVVLIMAIALVISLELVNTAVESLTDLAARGNDPLAGKVKDVAAAAVMIGSLAAALAGVIIFSNYIF